MSKKSGVSAEVLPVPSNGVQGGDDAFTPDLHTGNGRYAVPLKVPAGRGGLQPRIDLAYSNGFGNGLFGLDWRIGIPHVARSTSRRLPKYDRDDEIVLDGTRLVAMDADSTSMRYRAPATAAVKVRKRIDRDHAWWEVRSSDGQTHLYGTPASAEPGWRDPGAVCDPNDPARVARWWLTRTTDAFGNRIEYEYERDPLGASGPRRWDQLYPKEIRYCDFGDRDSLRYLTKIRFRWENRPDSFSDFRSGFEIRTTRRCTRIDIITNTDVERPCTSYVLEYLDQVEAEPMRQPANGCSLLAAIGIVGHDGTRTESLPPLRLGYTALDQRSRRLFPVRFDGETPPNLGSTCELVDVHGRGLPDIVEIDSVVRYWKNAGDGRFQLPRDMPAAPGNVRLTDPGVRLLDSDGDGLVELVVSDPQPGAFPLVDGGFRADGFRSHESALSVPFDDPELRLLDLDGDGVVDAMRTGAQLECFFADASVGFRRVRAIARRDSDVFPDVMFSDPRVRLADMTGDGLLDIVRIEDGSLRYWPNLGHGDFGAAITMARSPSLPITTAHERILLGDLDGDGIADLAYVEAGRVTFWINRSGEGWSEPNVVTGTPARGDVRLVDLMGTGVAGFLWSDSSGFEPQMYYLELVGANTKPYLLETIDKQLGAITRVSYSPSTRYHIGDSQRVETRWSTTLPFPVHVVASVETVDLISRTKLTSEYRYRHGLWDGTRRELCGFGRVDQRDTYDVYDFNDSPPSIDSVPRQEFSSATETRHWFHHGVVVASTGAWREPEFSAEYWSGDARWHEVVALANEPLATLDPIHRRDALRSLRGRPLRSELYELDGSEREHVPLTIIELGHAARIDETSVETGEVVFFPHLIAERTTRWDRGDDPMTRLRVLTGYDAYGHPTGEINVAVARGRDPRTTAPPGVAPYLVSQSEWRYAVRDDATLFAHRLAMGSRYAVSDDGAATLAEVIATIRGGLATRRLAQRKLHFYDGPAFEGLPLGELGPFGAVVRVDELVLTEELARTVYAGVAGHLLEVDGAALGPEYPAGFLAQLPPLAGYVRHPGLDGLYARVVCNRYDFHTHSDARGLLAVRRDPMGHDLTLHYDELALLPVRTVDSTGLASIVRHDPRVLRVAEMTDPNGNRSRFEYSPLGLLIAVSVLGKPGQPGADDGTEPSVRFIHDAWAFANRREPVSVRTIRRVNHTNTSLLPTTVESVQFSDGFSRQVQTRTRAEAIRFDDASLGLPISNSDAVTDAVASSSTEVNVVVSGWRRYDNKGRVIGEWEPFTSSGWAFTAAAEATRGRRLSARFDALGRMVQAIDPDGSEERHVHGVPNDVAEPDDYRPTPWESYTYDANDNAGRTHASEGEPYRHHWNTPGSIVRDAFEQIVQTTSRTRERRIDGTWSEIREQVVRFEYDDNGHRRAAIDALGRRFLEQIHDLRTHSDDEKRVSSVVAIRHLDAGWRTFVFDAGDNEIERRDAKGSLTLRGFDPAGRNDRTWCRDDAAGQLTLRMRVSYGDATDAITRSEALAGNWLGRVHTIHDESGRSVLGPYDFKGNVLARRRCVLSDTFMLQHVTSNGVTPARVDWDLRSSTLAEIEAVHLDPEELEIELAYDAFNRLVSKRYPHDVAGTRHLATLEYSLGGLLESVSVDDRRLVDHIAYDHRGRTTLTAYGNGLVTRRRWDPATNRLARSRTERCQRIDGTTYHPIGGVLQDVSYEYDRAGNARSIRDRCAGRGIAGGSELRRVFDYDPLYQLVSATGRQTRAGTVGARWDEWATGNDPDATSEYVEQYTYDSVGNLASLRHTSAAQSYSRDFPLAAGSNQLANGYGYDANGNVLLEHAARHFTWDHHDRLVATRTQTGQAEPSVFVAYLYDSEGQRVKKLARMQGGRIESTIYLDGDFERHRVRTATSTTLRDRLHVLAGDEPVASLAISASGVSAVHYYLADHLANVEIVADHAGALLRREEYSPFGESMFGAAPGERFRFASKERDRESGLYFHGARYYMPWIGRWASVDPLLVISDATQQRRLQLVELVNGYSYACNNPIRYVDRTGLSAISVILNTLALVIRIASNMVSIAAVAGMYRGTTSLRTQSVSGAWDAGVAEFRQTLHWQTHTPAGVAVTVAAGILGVIHGIKMWMAGTHEGAAGFFGFLIDNTWGMPNSLVGSLWATITIGQAVDRTASEGTGRLVVDGFSSTYATTFGNVTAGQQVPRHENTHVWQSRIFGFYFYPLYAFNYVLNTVIPYWLLYQKGMYPSAPINDFGDYFMRGVYPCTVFEMWAYSVEGSPP